MPSDAYRVSNLKVSSAVWYTCITTFNGKYLISINGDCDVVGILAANWPILSEIN